MLVNGWCDRGPNEVVAVLEADECCPRSLAPLREADAAELARGFAALADPVRLRSCLIAAAGEVCSCDLEAPLARSQPTVSHHTKALAEAGLIVGDKRGRWMWWQVIPNGSRSSEPRSPEEADRWSTP